MTAELRAFVDIDATAERVWQVLTDLPAYSEWNPFIVGAEGNFAVGARPSLRLLPVNALVLSTLRPEVLEVVPVSGCGCAAGCSGSAYLACWKPSTP